MPRLREERRKNVDGSHLNTKSNVLLISNCRSVDFFLFNANIISETTNQV